MIELVETLSDEHVRQLHELYQHEWWSEGRSLPDVVRMLSETDLMLGLVDNETEHEVGFCRVLTDFVFQATLYDVIVRADARELGLGRRLIDSVLSHPRLASVRNIWLGCLTEMIPFYEKWGFVLPAPDLVWMRRSRPE